MHHLFQIIKLPESHTYTQAAEEKERHLAEKQKLALLALAGARDEQLQGLRERLRAQRWVKAALL